MRDEVKEARKLKSRAMALRDDGDHAAAIRLLEQAEGVLRKALGTLAMHRGTGEPPSPREVKVAEQLLYVLGSKGGVYRRWKKHEESVRAYDAGYEFEKRDSEYGIVNSYNLTQRLVARVFLEPRAVADAGIRVLGLSMPEELETARKEVARQQREEGRRDDEYAAADLATLLVLQDGPGWEDAVEDFADSSTDAYAVRVTREVFEDLRRAAQDSGAAPAELVERLEETLRLFEAPR